MYNNPPQTISKAAENGKIGNRLGNYAGTQGSGQTCHWYHFFENLLSSFWEKLNFLKIVKTFSKESRKKTDPTRFLITCFYQTETKGK